MPCILFSLHWLHFFRAMVFIDPLLSKSSDVETKLFRLSSFVACELVQYV